MVKNNRVIITKDISIMAKGLFMLAVFINHLFIEMKMPAIVRLTAHNLSQAGMFGFCFLSGYGLTISTNGKELYNYWNKRITKVYLPAVIVNAIYAVALVLLFHENYNRGYLFIEILMLNSMPEINWYLWFLRLLFVWYLLFYLATMIIVWFQGKTYIKKQIKEHIAFLVWGGIALFMWWIIPESFGLANCYCLSFPLGVLYGYNILQMNIENEKSEQINIKMLSIVMVMSILGIVISISMKDGVLFGNELNFYLSTFLNNVVYLICSVFIFMLMGIINNKYMKKMLIHLGMVSLWIYYLQEPLVVYPIRHSNRPFLAMSVGIICLISLSELITHMRKRFDARRDYI